MEEVQKKERTKNFTESDKMLLLELVQERCKILENKATNNCSVKEKEVCWEDLQMVFMSRSKGVVRTVQSLKTCWENIKKNKKQYAEEKQLMYTTGDLHLLYVYIHTLPNGIHLYKFNIMYSYRRRPM